MCLMNSRSAVEKFLAKHKGKTYVIGTDMGQYEAVFKRVYLPKSEYRKALA
jgi:hypothetical protein